jgi:hypothetical protein
VSDDTIIWDLDEDDVSDDAPFVPSPDFLEIQRGLRRDREHEERARADLEKRLVFNSQQQKRKHQIEMFGDPRQPPEYRGKVFERASRDGIHYDATPDMRDASHELTTEFIDFQNYNSARIRAAHPEYYCEECEANYAGVVCPAPGCRSAKVRYPSEGNKYRCTTCSTFFTAERVCGQCLSQRPEIQAQLRERDERKREKKATRTLTDTRGKIAYRPSTELYPD